MARPKLPLHLSAEQRAALQRLVRAPATPRKLARRARIALLAAEVKDNKQIAAEPDTSRVTVGQWRQRVMDLGLARAALACGLQVEKDISGTLR